MSNIVLQGLRAFLPKAELLNRVNSFRELKENVSLGSPCLYCYENCWLCVVLNRSFGLIGNSCSIVVWI